MKIIYELNSKEELEALISRAIDIALAKSIKVKSNLKEELLTTEELGNWLKLSRVSIYHLTNKKLLPFIRVGNQKRYSKAAVLKKLTENNHPNSSNLEV